MAGNLEHLPQNHKEPSIAFRELNLQCVRLLSCMGALGAFPSSKKGTKEMRSR